ncbi:VOC family protein [Amycolatopsis sp. NPDC051903]|uniref:VOC family protein n=1 Tax=Amycolatopsis sp. NPDC051903 TaxID=3363936 RepID=UPI0037B9C5D3
MTRTGGEGASSAPGPVAGLESSSAASGGQRSVGAVEDAVAVRPSAGDGCGFDLVFVPEEGPKRGKNRLHLDLASRTDGHQRELVERARVLGARCLDVGQGDVPWVVLADPGGNEFCVLEPRREYERAGALAALVVDATEPAELAEFWSARLGWPVVARHPVIVTLRAPSGRGPAIEFLRSADVKSGRNRLRVHLGERPDPAVDPEGNEFA